MVSEASPDSTGRQQDGRFAPGRSGNPAGRPRGARHRSTLAAEALLEGEAEALTRKCVELALAGDTVALRMALDRIAPCRKGGRVTVDLPPIEAPADVPKALAELLAAVGRGDLSPEEGTALAGMVEQVRRGLELCELEARLADVERRLGGGAT